MTAKRFYRSDLMVPLLFAASGAFVLIAAILPSWVPVQSPPAAPSIAIPSPAPVSPLRTYVAIAARSLFNPDRRPDPAPLPASAAKPAAPSADSYQLVGILLSSELRLALVERRQGGEVLRLREGDTLDGWMVKTVSASGVELAQANTSAELTIAPATKGTETRRVNSVSVQQRPSTE